MVHLHFLIKYLGVITKSFAAIGTPTTATKLQVGVAQWLKARALENHAWICLEQVWTVIELGDRTLFL